MNTTANAIPPPTKTGHVEVRGVNYYYEIRGKGEPLLLLHGVPFSIDMFGANLAILSAQREAGGLKDAGWGREHMSKNRLAILPNLTHYEIGAAPALGHHSGLLPIELR